MLTDCIAIACVALKSVRVCCLKNKDMEIEYGYFKEVDFLTNAQLTTNTPIL